MSPRLSPILNKYCVLRFSCPVRFLFAKIFKLGHLLFSFKMCTLRSEFVNARLTGLWCKLIWNHFSTNKSFSEELCFIVRLKTWNHSVMIGNRGDSNHLFFFFRLSLLFMWWCFGRFVEGFVMAVLGCTLFRVFVGDRMRPWCSTTVIFPVLSWTMIDDKMNVMTIRVIFSMLFLHKTVVKLSFLTNTWWTFQLHWVGMTSRVSRPQTLPIPENKC